MPVTTLYQSHSPTSGTESSVSVVLDRLSYLTFRLDLAVFLTDSGNLVEEQNLQSKCLLNQGVCRISHGLNAAVIFCDQFQDEYS